VCRPGGRAWFRDVPLGRSRCPARDPKARGSTPCVARASPFVPPRRGAGHPCRPAHRALSWDASSVCPLCAARMQMAWPPALSLCATQPTVLVSHEDGPAMEPRARALAVLRGGVIAADRRLACTSAPRLRARLPVFAVAPVCSASGSCSDCVNLDDCAWCASAGTCLPVAAVFEEDCRGTVFAEPCPASFAYGEAGLRSEGRASWWRGPCALTALPASTTFFSRQAMGSADWRSLCQIARLLVV